ncbi:hypothetical protein M408DRAFT_25155 [Serendipita vermifera MAFF 305830]|uniref:DUF6534 domain-containing protein n=1 Tax=Serendipita vermifera MAFF 305830 TaxID=933852 RepID=A0A0C2XC05_SERVB|nr:hypothetical protein M408DRAFT_25155 [Serendipita vermifera MAFF 305830]
MSRNSSDALTRSLLSQDMERQLSVSLVAVMIFYLLLGIILCQIKNYVHIALTQRRGDIKNHLVVGFLSLVTISKSILAGLDISRLVIENFGKPAAADAILDSDWIHLSGPISTVVVAIVVDLFFTRRYYKLSGNKLVVFIAVSYVIAYLGFGNAALWLSLGLSFQLICNATISFATIYHFHKQKADTFRQSMNLLDRLIQMALRSALPPTFMAAVALVTTEIYGITDAVPFACAVIVSQTFFISLLYTLNARESMRRTLAGRPRNLSWMASNVGIDRVSYLGEEGMPQFHSAPAADTTYYQSRQVKPHYRQSHCPAPITNDNGVMSCSSDTAVDNEQNRSKSTGCWDPSAEDSLFDHDITVGHTASSLVRNETIRDDVLPLTAVNEESRFSLQIV